MRVHPSSQSTDDVVAKSRRRTDIHSSITAYIDLLEGSESLEELRTGIKDHIFHHFHLVWTFDDVKYVLRTAANEGNKILMEQRRKEEITARYEDVQKEIAAFTGTRSAEADFQKARQNVIKAFRSYKEPTHGTLPLAQLALHKAVQTWRVRGAEDDEEKKKEKKQSREELKKINADERKREKEEERRRKEESKKKAQEDRERKKAEEDEGAKAANLRIAKQLSEGRVEMYQQKAEDRQLRSDWMRESLITLKRWNEMLRRKSRKQRRRRRGSSEKRATRRMRCLCE
jgi:hypothetical protein